MQVKGDSLLVMHADECNLMTDKGCVLAVPPFHGFSKETAKARQFNCDKIANDIVIQVQVPLHTLNTHTRPLRLSGYAA